MAQQQAGGESSAGAAPAKKADDATSEPTPGSEPIGKKLDARLAEFNKN